MQENTEVGIDIEQLTSWNLVLNLARGTVGMKFVDKEPSEKFKHGVLDPEHSPIRALFFRVTFTNLPYFVSVHLVRHKHGVEHFVSTQRTDRTGVERDSKRQDAPVTHTMIINAQELMFISRRRLCGKADPAIRAIWSRVVELVKGIDPVLASYCVPMCKYRGHCPEAEPCTAK